MKTLTLTFAILLLATVATTGQTTIQGWPDGNGFLSKCPCDTPAAAPVDTLKRPAHWPAREPNIIHNVKPLNEKDRDNHTRRPLPNGQTLPQPTPRKADEGKAPKYWGAY